MSEKCGCMWCQKDINKEKATAVRSTFIKQVFELAVKKMFSIQDDLFKQIVEAFAIETDKFFGQDEQYVQELIEPIINIVYPVASQVSGTKPYDVFIKCSQLHDVVTNGFKALKVDISLKETPILSGILTAEMFVNYEVDETLFPKEILNIYQGASNSTLDQITAVLQSTLDQLGVEVELPSREASNHTVH